MAGRQDVALYRVLMNINQCGCRPYGWLGLDGNRCIRVIPRQVLHCIQISSTSSTCIPFKLGCIVYKISLTSSTCLSFNLLHSVHNISDVFDMNYYIIFNLSALLRSLAIQIGRGMDHLLPGGLRGMAL